MGKELKLKRGMDGLLSPTTKRVVSSPEIVQQEELSKKIGRPRIERDEPITKVAFYLKSRLHKMVKIRAVEEEIPTQDLINRILEDYFSKE